jgi:transglutaminase-like putative cysteine protease
MTMQNRRKQHPSTMLGGLAVCTVAALTACASGDDTTSAAPNPLTTIRSRLTNYSDVEVFRVSSDTESYWRLTVLPAFDGEGWRVPESELEYIGDVAGRTPEGHEIRQEIEVRALDGSLVPVAPEPVQASSPADELRWSEALGALFTTTDLASGDRFEIVSRSPDYSAQKLRTATTDDPPGAGHVALPNAVPAVLPETARAITADAATDYDRLLMLQRWFRTEFEYSLEVQAGHGYSAVEGLLRTRVGHSEQFASAFAVLARTLGMPSRVAVGFSPGELRSDGRYSVANRHSHAWPEIWFDGLGWVPFEPTPTSRSEPTSLDSTATTSSAEAG